MAKRRPATALSIAGSDSSGGAGIEADLKAFGSCGVYGMCAITAVTAQNTVGVGQIQVIDPEVIADQIRSVCEDIGVDAVKIGMLANAETVDVVERALSLAEGAPVVLDPVMVSETGAELLDGNGRAAVIERLIPKATVVTPNVSEARLLCGASDERDLEALAEGVKDLGATAVVVTGGHAEAQIDLYLDGLQKAELGGVWHKGGAGHGSGCTHSAALAAHLALGYETLDAARRARTIASEAVVNTLTGLGSGKAPVDVLGLSVRR
jgi:hydroxymethylpyrimidine/phosphomethylpyrimidine kinase